MPIANGSGFLSSTHARRQRKKLLAGSALRGALDFPVTRHERTAKRREDSAAAVFSAYLPFIAVRPQIRLISSTRTQARL